MRVSLNLVKKYIDLPKELTYKQIAYDLTLRTVEVESVENTSEKFHDIIVGKILEIKKHPNADSLKLCITDIGEEEPVQIVCGGSNLYEGELVIVSKPGAEVYWHGEGELVKIKKSNLRGESSFGMICGATEIFLKDMFPPKDEREIVDLKGIDCKPGQNIADVLELADTILEIDNKSLTNRPDLWGHYGIARELSAIYHLPLKPLPKFKVPDGIKKYEVEIKESQKCQRYAAVEIDNVDVKQSPLWMQAILINTGSRPINAIVDITNFVMIATGQPEHAFDKTHVEGDKIVVRNAQKGEKLELLDKNYIELTEDDLVICDTKEPMALAGIRGGIKDSILPETTSVVLEVANFTAKGIRKTGKRFDEKTDASIRYEKNIDTQRVDDGLSLALELFKEIFPESKITAFVDNYPIKTENEIIDVPEEFLNTRLGKILPKETIERVLTDLGYKVEYAKGNYHVTVPVWRSTGDVYLKDDVMGDIARLLSFESFEPVPITMCVDHAVLQRDYTLERRIKEYLALRCGFNEIFTYPWIDEKYIDASGANKEENITLVAPPSPSEKYLRTSLLPGSLEAITNNLRYFNEFKMFEIAEVFKKGEYHPSTEEETLPIQEKHLIATITGKEPQKIFYELKGVLEMMAGYVHMEDITLKQGDKPSWADINVHLDILLKNKKIGEIGLLSIKTMNAAKIKRTNVAVLELNLDKLEPLDSRTNNFKHIPVLPSVEKDLSVLVPEEITWKEIENTIKNRVDGITFIEEYRGNQIPEGQKSISFKFTIDNKETTMTAEQINEKMNSIIKELKRKCKATLREE
ncbi:MAG: phenylalanine--tRNA ligase subunit beta [bacterium]|nr:phenylalanine--tRNA ligase subunit beta [bacterium]